MSLKNKARFIREARKKGATNKELFMAGLIERKIINITEENLKYMLKYGKVDERIYG